ncbi:MAG: ABC transporter permease subunit [Deltaproteobacteria bacterium]|nr:ABC transporter permease subunit [Deltaproteobacteria bacterium]
MSHRPPAPLRVLVYVFVAAATLATLYPVALVVKKSVSRGQSLDVGVSPIPTSFSGEHFANLFKGNSRAAPSVLHQLANSLIVSIGTAIVGLLFSMAAAFALSRLRFPGQRAGLWLLLVTQIFPSTLFIIPLYAILDSVGLLDNALGLILVYSTTSIPFSVWTLKGYFDTIPREIDEAARLDGASAVTLFWRIILPISRPALAVVGLFSFMTAWNEFILAATFLSRESAYTMPVVLAQFSDPRASAWGSFAAGSVIVSLPVVILFFLLQRHLVHGLAAGSTKG